ncbi:unnamed protein product, partial [Choristocarpus tenellus]
QEAEQEFSAIGEAIVSHLHPSELPLTRALALDAAQTFVQRVLSCRSRDKQSSKLRRRAFKVLLAHLVPFMLDCLQTPTDIQLPAPPPSKGTEQMQGPGQGTEASPGASCDGSGAKGDVTDLVGGEGELVVLHFYQQYQLKVAALDTMGRLLIVLRALFRPPLSNRVQLAVAPLLDAEEVVLRDKAANVLGKLSLCGKDLPEWTNIAISVSLEAHSLLQEAWPDEGQVPPSKLEDILQENRLLPPLHKASLQGDPEGHMRAVGRRFPSLCKLLTALLVDPLPRPGDSEVGHGTSGGVLVI